MHLVLKWPPECSYLSERSSPAKILYPSYKENKHMTTLLKQLWRDEEGQDLTEYALLLVLISLIAVASLRVAGQAVSDAFSNAAANLTTNT
jgi:Flp pilus assembly pilin Flp